MKLRQLVFPLALACSPAALAGDLGATSTDSTDVSVTIGDLVQVLVEGNIALNYSVGAQSTGSAGLCIYRNGGSSVNLTLTSTNANGGTFRMNSGGNLLPYSVALTGNDSVPSIDSGNANQLTGANTTSSNCGGTYGHDIDVTVNSADLDAAPAGSYTDTITILVEPV